MSNTRISKPGIDALVLRLVCEINKMSSLGAVALSSEIMRLLAERLHELSVEVVPSTKNPRT